MNTRLIISIFLAALLLLILSSQHSGAARRESAVQRAPARIEHEAGVANLRKLDGKKVSVTFWSSDNAASRYENIRNANAAKTDPTREHIGVNIDDAPDVYQALLLRDNLRDDSLQFRVEGDVAQSFAENYGYKTVCY